MREPTHAELRATVERCEPLLRDLWARRHDDTAIIILADLRRADTRPIIGQFWTPEAVERVKAEAARRAQFAYLPILQPAALIDQLLTGKHGWAQREAGKELKAFAALAPAVVPLWVAHTEGHWATCWSPPGSDVVVARFEPEPAADRN